MRKAIYLLSSLILYFGIPATAKTSKQKTKVTLSPGNNSGPDAGFAIPGGTLKDIEMARQRGQYLIPDIKQTTAYIQYASPILERFSVLAPIFAEDLKRGLAKVWYRVNYLPQSNNGFIRQGLQNENEVYILDEVLRDNKRFGDLIIHELFVALARNIWNSVSQKPSQTNVEEAVGILLFNQGWKSLTHGDQLLRILDQRNLGYYTYETNSTFSSSTISAANLKEKYNQRFHGNFQFYNYHHIGSGLVRFNSLTFRGRELFEMRESFFSNGQEVNKRIQFLLCSMIANPKSVSNSIADELESIQIKVNTLENKYDLNSIDCEINGDIHE